MSKILSTGWIAPTITGIGKPLKLRKGTANRIIDNFKKNHTHRSVSGGTLWVILQWCHDNRWPYVIVHEPGRGWSVATVGVKS